MVSERNPGNFADYGFGSGTNIERSQVKDPQKTPQPFQPINPRPEIPALQVMPPKELEQASC
jgi:hypothetical protein